MYTTTHSDHRFLRAYTTEDIPDLTTLGQIVRSYNPEIAFVGALESIGVNVGEMSTGLMEVMEDGNHYGGLYNQLNILKIEGKQVALLIPLLATCEKDTLVLAESSVTLSEVRDLVKRINAELG